MFPLLGLSRVSPGNSIVAKCWGEKSAVQLVQSEMISPSVLWPLRDSEA